MADALFVIEGERFVPTAKAGSPWGDRMVHGGPISGLLAHAVEQFAGDPEMHVVRLTVDLFRPVPMVPLAVTARTVRHGRRVHAVDATLFADDAPMARASALLLRRSVMPVPVTADDLIPAPPWLEGEAAEPLAGPVRPGRPVREGFHTTVETRWVTRPDMEFPTGVSPVQANDGVEYAEGRRGGAPDRPPQGSPSWGSTGPHRPQRRPPEEPKAEPSGRMGNRTGFPSSKATPAEVWVRVPVTLVAGEPLTPLVRIAATCDFVNAIGSRRRPAGVGFINADNTLYLQRLPVGEWIGLRVERSVDPAGVGVSLATLFDRGGFVGRSAQSLLANSYR